MSNNLETWENSLRVYELVTSLKSDIELSREKIVENNSSFNELSQKIQNVLAEHSESLSDLENKLLAKVRELYDDNKKYQKELDNTLNSKLEKNKSDIEVTVRSEGTQIQRAFETSLNSNFNEMKQVLDNKFEEHSKKTTKHFSVVRGLANARGNWCPDISFLIFIIPCKNFSFKRQRITFLKSPTSQ